MVLNSLLSLVIISPPDKITKLVTTFCESIVRAQLPERFGIVKLRVLSNLFHGLPPATSKDRYVVYLNLAKCSISARNLHYLPTDLDVCKKHLAAWSATLDETQALYRLLFECLAQMSDSQNALKVIIELLGTYTKENAAKSRDDAHRCILYCINDPNTFVFDSLLLLEPIKYLEGELIHNLFTIFVSGKLKDYVDFYENHKSLFAQLGMNHERNIAKMRILNFLSLAENNKELPFDVLQKQLQIEPDEIESFAIDAIRTKCIRCKIDHLARLISVMSVSYRTFNKPHWTILKERLEKWKDNLKIVNQNLTTILQQSLLQQQEK